MSEQTATVPTRDTTYVEAFDIQQLIPYDKNPRKNDDAINAVAESIKAFGFTNPLIINDDKIVCCGHTRLEAAKRLGLTTVPVKIMHGLTDTEFAALNIADNQTGNLAVWDDELLAEQIRDILAAEEPFDVSVLAFDDGELRDIMAHLEPAGPEKDPDAIPEPPVTPITQLGDLWLLDGHRLLCGDSTKPEDVKRLMDGEKADMVFTDPPYGLGGYAGRSGKFAPIAGDDGDPDTIQGFYACIPTDVSERYIWGNWQVLRLLPDEPRDVIVWRKNNFGMGRGYRGQYEICFYYGAFAGSDSDVWDVARDTKYQHPTQKPVALAERAMRNSSTAGDVILDIYAGSGTTILAAEQLYRKCYAMEIDPIYCDVAVKRWEDFTGKKAVLDAG